MLLWGDSDAVAPFAIAKSLATDVMPKAGITGRTMQGAGHFLMVEQPDTWAKLVADFVSNSEKAVKA